MRYSCGTFRVCRDERIDERPRETLQFETPAERFDARAGLSEIADAMTVSYRLHYFPESGNSYKLALMLTLCGQTFDPV